MSHRLRSSPASIPARLRDAVAELDKWSYALGIRPRDRLCLPDFLGIGVQKAGTTWLHRNLECHPELFLTRPKELHYWDWEYHRSLRCYSRKFQPAAGKIKGEVTPGYSILAPRRIRLLHAVQPDLRLLLLLRDPVERAWSHALMDLVRNPGRRYEEVPTAEFLAHFRSPASLTRGDYFRTLENWLRFFSRDQLYVGFYHDISKRPEVLLTEIFRHIGVSADVDWSRFPIHTRPNAGPRIEMPRPCRDALWEIYAPRLDALRERLGPAVDRWRSSAPDAPAPRARPVTPEACSLVSSRR